MYKVFLLFTSCNKFGIFHFDLSYFTRTEYSDIADSLLRHFPYLPASEGLSRPDSQVKLKTKAIP